MRPHCFSWFLDITPPHPSLPSPLSPVAWFPGFKLTATSLIKNKVLSRSCFLVFLFPLQQKSSEELPSSLSPVRTSLFSPEQGSGSLSTHWASHTQWNCSQAHHLSLSAAPLPVTHAPPFPWLPCCPWNTPVRPFSWHFPGYSFCRDYSSPVTTLHGISTRLPPSPCSSLCTNVTSFMPFLTILVKLQSTLLITFTVALISFCIKIMYGTSLVLQWLRLQAPNAGGPGSVPGQGTRSHVLQLRVHIPQ